MPPMTNSEHTVTALFLDIGGVLLTNGWDRAMRQRAAERFHLDFDEMDDRHHMTFDPLEEDALSLDDYLRRVVFYQPRNFSPDDFRAFMFAQSQPLPGTMDLIRGIKARYELKVVAVSNEGRELNAHRIRTFNLASLIDVFVSSCFVHKRKPDPDIYRIAFDIAQVTRDDVVYIDDRAMFVEVARDLGIRGIHHTDAESTRAKLVEFGLTVEKAGAR